MDADTTDRMSDSQPEHGHDDPVDEEITMANVEHTPVRPNKTS